MSNELVKQMPQTEMLEMAKLFVESKMFKDISAVGMAFVKIQAGKEIGIAPFAAMSGIHVIQGKPTVGAGLMAGCVKSSGKYDYKVAELTDTICSIDFYKGAAKIGNSTFTYADATKAVTQNMAKFPKNMLFARAMSNGVKWYCPDVFTMPVYTPEEMGDPNFTEDIQHEEVKAPNAAHSAKPTLEETNIDDTAFEADRKQKELQAATVAINASTSLDQLREIYTALTPELQAATVADKNVMKVKLIPAKPTLNEMEFASAIEGIKAGTQTVAGITGTFLLTQAQLDTLNNTIPATGPQNITAA